MTNPPDDRPTGLPSYHRPPLREVAFSVMFEPLEGFSSADVGRFWTQAEVAEEFDTAVDLPPIDTVLEVFDGQTPAFFKRLTASAPTAPMQRVQLRGTSRTRMLQVQPDRLVYNWIHPGDDSAYPRYHKLRGRFDLWLRLFGDFLQKQGRAAPRIVQWELVYVNSIPRGSLWRDEADIPELFPGLKGGEARLAGLRQLWDGRRWRFERRVPDARLLVELQRLHGFADPDRQELHMTWTSRGPAEDSSSLSDGLDAGHEMIVRGFKDAASDAANRAWGLDPA